MTHDTDGGSAVEHGLNHDARLNDESEQRRRKFLLKSRDRGGKRASGNMTVDGTLKFRFKTAGQILRRALSKSTFARHRTCIGEKRAALSSSARKMSASIEQFQPSDLQDGQHGSRRTARDVSGGRRRETTLICGRKKSAELIQ